MPPPAAAPARLSRPAFVAAVAACGVGPTARELAALADELPPDAAAAAVAHRLVVRGVLTRFQADRLLAGRGDGLAFGPYLILEPLGEEDGGRAFRARHRVMDRLVSVWVSAPDNPRRAERLEAARQAARLAHPHVLTVLDVDPAGRGLVVTEFVDGATLDAVVRLAGRLPVGRACDILRQVALGLAHAHERGVSHGRLAAEWVLVGRPGGGGPEGRMAVKLTGFAGGPDGAGDDLAALGQLGRHLFAGKAGTPPPPLPLEVTRLLGELAGRRPPTATEVAERLAPFADGDYGRVEFELPGRGLGGTLASGYLSGANPAADTCPFADMLADQPTAVTPRPTPPGGRALLTVAGVAAVVVLAVVVLVVALLPSPSR